jgi:branched-chain amino acid transport system substrate-binding protein
MSVISKAGSGIAILAASALVLSGCAAAEEAPASAPAEEASPAVETIELKIGTALPVTGSLAFLGPPEIAGVDLAVAEINAANLGIQIDLIHGDSGDTDNKAYEVEIPRLLAEGVSAIIGAASSGVSLQFIDQVIGAGVIQLSPANTSPVFTDYADDGLYWRTAPDDNFQGQVLGNLLAEDGHSRVAMLVLNDAYGTGLAAVVKETFEATGGQIVAEPTFNAGDTTFTSQLNTILATDPEAIVLITFDEAITIIPELVTQFPGENLYFVDGNIANYGDCAAFGGFEAGTLEGAKGTGPGVTPEFFDRLKVQWLETGDGSALCDYQYGPESYDGVILIALAALAAQSTDGKTIAAAFPRVEGGDTKCTTFAECAQIILAGGTADYDGVSGEISWDEVGDRKDGFISISQYDGNNFPVQIN